MKLQLIHRPRLALIIAVASLAMILAAIFALQHQRAGIDVTEWRAGTTPVSQYQLPEADGPLVVIAHGFAGSRQMMEAYALTLARAGYRVASFDFVGHGRNPVPMSGDVTAVDGTTALLITETRRVIAVARERMGWEGRIGLLGHSMASDIVVRTGMADPRAGPIVAISMYSEAVDPLTPERLLVITGAGEPHLREVALEALRQVDPQASEGETAQAAGVTRRAVVAPYVEHVGVLHSATALEETLRWFDEGFDRPVAEDPLLHQPGPWVVFLLVAVVALAWPLSRLMPVAEHAMIREPLTAMQFVATILVPTILTPLIAAPIDIRFLPVLVADYLAVHLFIFGVLQGLLLWRFGIRVKGVVLPAAGLLAGYGILAFGLALDWYGASFMPHDGRAAIIVAVAVGAVPFMVADSVLLQRTGVGLGQRILARLAFLASLGIAVTLDFQHLFFLVVVLPVILLFFVVFGLLGRWTANRAGPLSAGLGLGIVLAWSIGVSFPLFAQ